MFSFASLIFHSILPAEEGDNRNSHIYITLCCQLHFHHPFAVVLVSSAFNICLKWPVNCVKSWFALDYFLFGVTEHGVSEAQFYMDYFHFTVSCSELERYSLSSTRTWHGHGCRYLEMMMLGHFGLPGLEFQASVVEPYPLKDSRSHS